MDFKQLTEYVRDEFMKEWGENRGDLRSVLLLQKKAIIGYAREVGYFKDKIARIIDENAQTDVAYPNWYPTLVDAVFHENWGLSGIAEWFEPRYRDSSSAKIIGDRIYFLYEGRMRLMPQRIDKERREQLVRSFLLLSPEERMDKNYHEVYLLDGTRITIFRGDLTKNEQDTIVCRRYIIPTYTFEEQAERGTIPAEAVPLFKAMAGAGFNVVFTGPLRSAKTTFLSTWQAMEDPTLEGVMVETDPEIPLHKLMPNAPILQILADGERLESVSKNLLRSDADYIVIAEARDGAALDLAVRMAGKGTRRMKMTFHLRNPYDFPYDAAWEIMKARGTNLTETARKVASGFDYIFHLVPLKDKRKKRLRGIYEISRGEARDAISIEPVCLYDFQTDSWTFRNRFSQEKRAIASEENPGSERVIEELLEALSTRFPMEGGGEDHRNRISAPCIASSLHAPDSVVSHRENRRTNSHAKSPA